LRFAANPETQHHPSLVGQDTKRAYSLIVPNITQRADHGLGLPFTREYPIGENQWRVSSIQYERENAGRLATSRS